MLTDTAEVGSSCLPAGKIPTVLNRPDIAPRPPALAGTGGWTAAAVDTLGMRERYRALAPLLREGVEAHTPHHRHAPTAMTMLLRCGGDALVAALAGTPEDKDTALAALVGECVVAMTVGADAPDHPGWAHLDRKARRARERRFDGRKERGQVRHAEAALIAAGAARPASEDEDDDDILAAADDTGDVLDSLSQDQGSAAGPSGGDTPPAVPPGDVDMPEAVAGKRLSDRPPGEAEPMAKRSPTPTRSEEGARPGPMGHAFGGMD